MPTASGKYAKEFPIHRWTDKIVLSFLGRDTDRDDRDMADMAVYVYREYTARQVVKVTSSHANIAQESRAAVGILHNFSELSPPIDFKDDIKSCS